MLTMETSLKKILCCELTAGILSTLSEIQINIVNYQPKEHAHRENCIHVFYFQKQLKNSSSTQRAHGFLQYLIECTAISSRLDAIYLFEDSKGRKCYLMHGVLWLLRNVNVHSF